MKRLRKVKMTDPEITKRYAEYQQAIFDARRRQEKAAELLRACDETLDAIYKERDAWEETLNVG